MNIMKCDISLSKIWKQSGLEKKINYLLQNDSG